jgi:transmembrane sensor
VESRIARLNRIAPRRIRAQAVLWVTELHSPDRSASLEAKVREWLAADPRHAAAFELATEAWQSSGNTPAELLTAKSKVGAFESARPKLSRPVAAGMILLLLALMAGIYLARDESLGTGPGEQRTVELADGTELSLNANSHVRVQFDKRVRKVTLVAGEALFDVSKNPARPFVVVIGDRKVIALGTSFMVRREEGSATAAPGFTVTLVEGRVAVEPLSGPDALLSGPTAGAKLLRPGERLSVEGGAPERVDSPSIDQVTAWRRGQLIFEDTSLSEAAAEFNRYSSKKLTIEGSAAGKLRVGGVFRIGDPASFAQAMANTYHLRILNRGKQLILTEKAAD